MDEEDDLEEALGSELDRMIKPGGALSERDKLLDQKLAKVFEEREDGE